MKKFLGMKEPVNTLTHFATLLASVGGLIFLVLKTWHNTPKLITMTVYGVSIIVLYGASSLYHWVKTTPRKNLILKKLDHIAIYLLISGSYTPVFYYGLTGTWRWAMLTAVWVLAFTGILLKIWFIAVPRYVSTVFYLTLGWIALVPFLHLFGNLPVGAVYMMFMGGVAYTVGAIIYATKCFNLFPNRFGFHEIFHLFVMAGSIIHFIMIVRYFVPL